MSNILITGASGFIGSYLCEHLSQNANNVIYGLSRSLKPESTFNALKLNEKKNVNLIFGDVNKITNILEILNDYKIDQMYHLAAKVIVRNSAKTPTVTYSTNMLGTLNVLESIRLVMTEDNKYIPTLVMSSDKCYGTSDKLPYKEDLPLNGLDVYSSSKACEDIIARSYAFNYNLPVVVARPSNAYGIDFNFSRLVPSLSKAYLLEKDKPLILNKGSYRYIREYTYAKDLVRALELLVKNIDKTKGEAYNISSEETFTTEQVVNTFSELVNPLSEKIKGIQFREKESTFKEIEKQYLDISKLKSVIDWKPEYSLVDGLLETIDKYREWFNNQNMK